MQYINIDTVLLPSFVYTKSWYFHFGDWFLPFFHPQPPVREGPVTRSASRAASLHSLSDASSDSFSHSPGKSSTQ